MWKFVDEETFSVLIYLMTESAVVIKTINQYRI